MSTHQLRSWILPIAALLAIIPARVKAQPPLPRNLVNRNRPERVEWFRDAGFGLFIHWSVDGQIGTVISHSLVGASEDYVKRYFEELPRTFNPKKFDPAAWAVQAKLAGFKYVVFTTKHHNGFCMYDSGTTDFDVASTPFRRDITAEVVEAFRAQGIAIGFYFSPDDFLELRRQGMTIARNVPEVEPRNNKKLLELDRAQLRELLTHYGKIDVIFLDGPAEGLTDLCWDLQPDIVVTRGAMETPEQSIPGAPLKGPWESCITMGTSWQYQPTDEVYKSGTRMIEALAETRAKGGNLLLNVGPRPDGELPIEQEQRLQEIALWMFVNGEAIHGVRPWTVTNEGPVWFTRRPGRPGEGDTVYAIVTGTRWAFGQRRSFVLHSVKTTGRSEVSILGQSGKVLEYHPEVVPRTEWRQDADGLKVSAINAQRLHDDRTWPNPAVIRITHAESGPTPPGVEPRK